MPQPLIVARRYRATASGAKIAMIAADHRNASQTSLWAGAPSHSERIASTVIVNGLTSANARRGSGMLLTGTNIEEMNVSGNTAMKPTELAASGESTIR